MFASVGEGDAYLPTHLAPAACANVLDQRPEARVGVDAAVGHVV